MVEIRNIKIIQLIACTVLFFSIISIMLFKESQSCMDVPLIAENKLEEYHENLEINFEEILFNGEKVAADIERGRIYISQSIEQLGHNSVLQGSLSSKNYRYTLYFLDNATMKDIPGAVQEGCPLKLVIVCGDAMQVVDVIITTLPVMRVDDGQMVLDEIGREIFVGNMVLWAGNDPGTKGYSTKTSELKWRKRGNSTSFKEKNSWKLSLIDRSGGNNLNLLGLGSDDDWILNSMVMDDTKIKEKLFMDVWNVIAAGSVHNYKMSTGEYVEVVINGKYMGVYLLQRRLDTKYLEINKEDVLLKATNYGAKNAIEAYEIVSGLDDSQKIYEFMQVIFEGSEYGCININNFIDVNIMLMLMSAKDNEGLKNIYFLLKKSVDGYEVFLIPWDTDMSLGVIWVNEQIQFDYDYRLAMMDIIQRRETEGIKNSVTDYNQQVRDRWEYLKQSVLSEKQILTKIEELEKILNVSCTMQREKERWGNLYGGKDNVNNMKIFVKERSKMMDSYYKLQ